MYVSSLETWDAQGRTCFQYIWYGVKNDNPPPPTITKVLQNDLVEN